MSRRVIKDDDELQRAESQLFLMAAELDDPLSLMEPKEKRRKLAIYDRTSELIEYYRRGRMVQKYPGLREQYRILGKEFQEFAEPSPPETVPAETPPEPKQEPPKPKPSLSAWLD